jgi:two-component system, cell cycle response regulator
VSAGRILVAEDSRVVRALVRAQLLAQEYEVIEAADGVEAVAALHAHSIDVVLCDVEMPNMGGYGVLEAMQADPALALIPFVFLTGHTDSEQAAEALRRGALDYLRKPFEPVELAARIHASMRTKRLQDELRVRAAELERLSSTDALTGLNNRRFMQETLARFAAMERRHGTVWSVAMLDLDRFKSVNDTYGHAAGDAILCQAAERLAGRIRTEDVLARWGGEEFLVVFPETAGAGAAAAAESLRATIAKEPMVFDGGEVHQTVSIGWAEGFDGSAEATVQRADEAVYRAKATGRNRVCGPETSDVVIAP